MFTIRVDCTGDDSLFMIDVDVRSDDRRSEKGDVVDALATMMPRRMSVSQSCRVCHNRLTWYVGLQKAYEALFPQKIVPVYAGRNGKVDSSGTLTLHKLRRSVTVSCITHGTYSISRVPADPCFGTFPTNLSTLHQAPARSSLCLNSPLDGRPTFVITTPLTVPA